MFVCVCVCRQGEGGGRVRGAAQTSSIQKQMEKVMIICLANAAQSGREGSTREVREGEGGGSGGGKERRVQDEAVCWTLRIRPVAHLIAVHK